VTVRSIFHININCSDLEASVAFYEKLGFRRAMEMAPFEGIADESYGALGVSGGIAHVGPVVLFLGNDPRQTRLDLMQWEKPAPGPHLQLEAYEVGVPRIALWTKDVDELYADLLMQGVNFLTAPQGPFPDRAIKSLVALRDPDGLLIELIEFLPGGKALYDH